MNLEQKILLASIREMNELIGAAYADNQLNIMAVNLVDLKERIKRFGDNNTGTSDSRIEPHSD
jgi:hypothetical protein